MMIIMMESKRCLYLDPLISARPVIFLFKPVRYREATNIIDKGHVLQEYLIL